MGISVTNSCDKLSPFLAGAWLLFAMAIFSRAVYASMTGLQLAMWRIYQCVVQQECNGRKDKKSKSVWNASGRWYGLAWPRTNVWCRFSVPAVQDMPVTLGRTGEEPTAAKVHNMTSMYKLLSTKPATKTLRCCFGLARFSNNWHRRHHRRSRPQILVC